MMRTALIAIGLGCVPLSACGEDDGGVAKCSELYVEGAEGAEEIANKPCTDDGEVSILIYASYDCQDGSELSYNDWGWWSDVDDVMHVHARSDGQLVPPDDVTNQCNDV